MKPDNGHHELMDQMEEFAGSIRENDYLEAIAPAVDIPSKRDELEVGQRVKQLREKKGLSLIDLAQRTGMSQEELKGIEQGKSAPPLGILIKLGKALEMKLGTLIAAGEERPYTVVRVAERMDMSRYPYSRETSYGYSYQALAPQKINRSMEPFLVTLRTPTEEVAPLFSRRRGVHLCFKGRHEGEHWRSHGDPASRGLHLLRLHAASFSHPPRRRPHLDPGCYLQRGTLKLRQGSPCRDLNSLTSARVFVCLLDLHRQ